MAVTIVDPDRERADKYMQDLLKAEADHYATVRAKFDDLARRVGRVLVELDTLDSLPPEQVMAELPKEFEMRELLDESLRILTQEGVR